MQATLIVSASIIDQGRMLLVQEGKPGHHGRWGLPGGRVEQGEGLAAAITREVAEETGYDVRITGMTRVLRYISRLGFHCVCFNFIAVVTGGAPRVDGEEILDLQWFTADEIAAFGDEKLRTASVARAAIADAFEGRVHPVGIVLDELEGG